MSTTPTIVGPNAVVWGTAGVYASGLITSASKLKTANKRLILDNNGGTVTIVYFDKRNECEFSMIVETAAPDLDIGDQIAIGGVANCRVDNCREEWRNDQEKMFTVNATAYDGIPASGGGG